MTTTSAPTVAPVPSLRAAQSDHRGSWVPNGRMIAARFTELRRRRGLMAMLAGVVIGIPAIYLVIRLILHAAAPHTYGPAGGSDTFDGLVAGVLYLFGFIVAATLGATAGSADLTDGMFRHHVITGRSRLALYFARIPAGLGIIVPMVAVGFAIVCFVCVFAAPTSATYDTLHVPAGLSQPALEQWAANHASEVVRELPLRINGTGPACTPAGTTFGPRIVKGPGGQSQAAPPTCTPSELRALAVTVAKQNYARYSQVFLTPSTTLMVDAGLWIELEAIIGFLIALGLASLLGQRTVAVVLMIVLEIVLTPIAARATLPHMINLQRAIPGLAMAHLEPSQLPYAFGGGGPSDHLISESTVAAICVVVAWIVGWTVLGAWRMATRDT